jgi:hypothetical protein
MSIKNYNYTIGNRTRDLPACSAVSQSTVPPRAKIIKDGRNKDSKFSAFSSVMGVTEASRYNSQVERIGKKTQ